MAEESQLQATVRFAAVVGWDHGQPPLVGVAVVDGPVIGVDELARRH